MAKSSFHILLAALSGVCLFLAGCSPAATTPPEPTLAARPASTVSIPVTPSPDWTALPAASSTPAATRTAAPPPAGTPTLALTILPVGATAAWFAPARELVGWPASARRVSWIDENRLNVTIDYDWMEGVMFDLRGVEKPLPFNAPLHNLPIADAQNNPVYFSPKGSFAVICAEKAEIPIQYPTFQVTKLTHRGLDLYRVRDNRLVSRAREIALNCDWGITWAPDESALSFASQSTRENDVQFPVDIYAWKTDGSQPYVISKGSFFEEPGNWSPDSTRLVVETGNPDPTGSDENDTYQIVYLDGRQPIRPGVRLLNMDRPGLTWLNGEVIQERNIYTATGAVFTLYAAETGAQMGEWRLGNLYDAIPSLNQLPLLSPDQRWYAVDNTEDSFQRYQYAGDKDFDFTYAMLDLHTLKGLPLWALRSPTVLLDFSGWDAASSELYLVRRPANDAVTEAEGEPFGLLAFNPRTLKMRLVSAEIRYAWMSPDGKQLFAAARKGGELFASFYNLNGKALTSPLRLEMPARIAIPELPKVQDEWNLPHRDPIDFAWSNSGEKIAIRENNGTVWVAGVDGTLEKIAAGLAEPDTNNLGIYAGLKWSGDEQAGMFWSPGDRYLVVRSGSRAWVITFGDSE